LLGKEERITVSEVDVYSASGKVVGKVNLPKGVFEYEPNTSVVHEVIKVYLANNRQGTASTKARAEVSGGGKKPWRQKGTGRARVGSMRSPLFRGGGVVFGPKPKSKKYKVSKKKKSIAIKSVLSSKFKEEEIKVVDELKFETGKTKELGGMLKKLGVGEKEKITLLMNSASENIRRSVSNSPLVNLRDALCINTYDVLNCKWLLMEQEALSALSKRILKNG